MFIIRAGAVYRRVEAQLNSEQAEELAVSISGDTKTLALFLKEQGLDKDHKNMMQVAQLFDNMAAALEKKNV